MNNEIQKSYKALVNAKKDMEKIVLPCSSKMISIIIAYNDLLNVIKKMEEVMQKGCDENE